MSIKRVKGGFKVVSKDGKSLSKTLKSAKAAAKRLRQVEHFKRQKR